jgi:hypothetical protein
MRIGERLVRAGLITREQLQEALSAQVVHGGRLGTNLIERSQISLDAMAEALAEQHQVPAALETDFATADPELQHQLTPELAAEYRAVPLRFDADSRRVVIAVIDPHETAALAELSESFRYEVTLAVAAELRIFYQLERVYGIRRPNRMLRVRTDAFHAVEPDEDYDQVEVSAGDDVEHAIEADEPAPPSAAPGRERRRFVRTLSDVEPPEAPAQLARIAVKRVAVGSEDTPLDEAASLDDRVRAIRQATGRDRVGDLVIAGLRSNLDLDAGVFLVVRDQVAIGWKGFVRDGSPDAVEAVAIPLHQPSILQPCYRDATTFIGSPADIATDIDRRLWTLLGSPPPADVTVVPVAPGGHVVCLLYAHVLPPQNLDAHLLRAVRSLAQATTSSFERLIRAAQR